MTILTQLTEDMKNAMRAHDSARLSAIRMLISAIKYAMVDTPDMDELAVTAVLSKEAKKRREAVVAYRDAGREEQAKAEEFELGLIEQYLPKMMSEDEVRNQLTASGAQLAAAANFGEAMKMAMTELKGKAEGGVVSKVVKEMLARQ